jgi:type III pantothenate kinase
MILEIDCGNTNVKWRIFQGTQIVAFGKNRKIIGFLNEIKDMQNIAMCRLVSVRTIEKTQRLIQSLQEFIPQVFWVKSTPFCAGVTNAYEKPELLGADRFLAMIAAYHLAQKAVLVIDLGTALTVDLIDKNGMHQGGIITPGTALMRTSLKQTALIDSVHKNNTNKLFGFNTQDAISCGCDNMIQTLLERYVTYARQQDSNTQIFFTGGGSKYYNHFQATFVKDLVMDGLALACPQGLT